MAIVSYATSPFNREATRWIDAALADPAQLSAATREKILAHQARYDFSRPINYPHLVLTRHGRVITPRRKTHQSRDVHRYYKSYNMASGLNAFIRQPRCKELQKAIGTITRDDHIVLQPGTGRFFSANALAARGISHTAPLGEIDITTEMQHFKMACMLRSPVLAATQPALLYATIDDSGRQQRARHGQAAD